MLQKAKCEMRLLQQEDLRLILEWRNDERIRAVMYTDHEIHWEEHQQWFLKTQGESYKGRHLLFLYDNIPLGQMNITDINLEHQRAYWGFFIGSAKAPKASGLAMGYFALEYVFTHLKLNKLCGEAIADNAASVNFHHKLGFVTEGILRQHIIKQEISKDIICFGHFADKWSSDKKVLEYTIFGEGKEHE